VVRCQILNKQHAETLSLADFLSKTQFDRRLWPNSGLLPNEIPLNQVRQQAVDEARRWMSGRRGEFDSNMRTKLNAELEKLQMLHTRTTKFVQMTPSDRRRDEKQRGVDRLFREYQDWIRDTMTTQDEPYLRIVAVFAGAEY
jgi:hypothetical protein